MQVTKRESSLTSKEFTKKVGVQVVEAITVNPTAEELRELGYNVDEDREIEYVSQDKEGNDVLRLSFKTKDQKGQHFDLTFFLSDKIVSNDKGKTQWVNSKGMSTWVDSESNLPSWFLKDGVEYHEARVGEAELYEFFNSWLEIDRNEYYNLFVDWNRLMRGDVSEIKEFWNTGGTFIVALYVRTKDSEDGVKEYQGVYNRKFLPGWNMKFIRNAKLTPEKIEILRAKDKKNLKPFEKFAVELTDKQYGIKDYFVFQEAQDYDPSQNIAATDNVIADDDSSY